MPLSNYQTGDFFVVRSPLLPFAALDTACDEADVGAGHAARRARTVGTLVSFFERPEVREALFLAAPDLERRIGEPLRIVSDAGLERVLWAYLTRLASRETPFGTFAGVSLGQIAEHTRLELAPRSRYACHPRLGMGFITRALAALENDDARRERLRYEPNATLAEAFGRLRYALFDAARLHGDAPVYPVVDVEQTPHLAVALARARGGATLDQIAAAVEAHTGQRGQGLRFARALVSHGVLVPTWRPAISGPEPFGVVCDELAAHGSADGAAIGRAWERLRALDGAAPGAMLPELRSIQQSLLPGATAAELGQLFQVDLVKPASALSLGRDDVAAFLRAACVIQQTQPPPADPRLVRFRDRFVERFESRRVPLVEALDPDLGIGFDGLQGAARDEWLDGLLGGRHLTTAPATFDEYDAVRLQMLTQCLRDGLQTCDLEQGWLDRFPRRTLAEPPESFAVIAQLATVEGRTCVVVPSVVGPSAVSLMARFCHADPALEQAVRRHCEREQALAAPSVLADVAHFPNGHVANVLLRPVLRAFEIPCGGKSGAPVEQQLPLSDLSVGVEGGRLILHSQRLGRSVRVRVTNAHNVDAWRNLPVYRFLGALQEADAGGLAPIWSWGALGTSPFLPRVVYRDVVLSRASWGLARAEIDALTLATGEDAMASVQALRNRLRMPRWVSAQLAAAPLVVDLDDGLSVEMLLHQLRDVSSVRFEELLPAPSQLVLRGPEGAFASELIVPFLRASQPAEQVAGAVAARAASRPTSLAARSFAPGSEWLYAKVYAGPSQHDALLEHVNEAVVMPYAGLAFDRWFFVPYADPEPHLRLRFHGEPRDLLTQVLPSLERALSGARERGVIWKLQLDTYEREIERYGGLCAMELAEHVFHADSEAALGLIGLCRSDPELRWMLTALGIDRLFACFGLELGTREALSAALLAAYRRELDVTAAVRKAIAAQYRRHAHRLGQLLWTPSLALEPEARRALELLELRSARLRATATALRRECARAGIGHASMVTSLVHMHAVRMFGANVRSYEMLLYDYLRRQYASRRALSSRPGRSHGAAPSAAGEPLSRASP